MTNQMYYDKITRRVHLSIGGEEYLLAFTLSGLEQLESRCGTSLYKLVSNNDYSLSTLVDGFWIGLMGGGKRVKREEAAAIASKYMQEQEGLGSLMNLFLGLLALSGILGVKQGKELLKTVNMLTKDEVLDAAIKEEEEEAKQKEQDDAKNAMKPATK